MGLSLIPVLVRLSPSCEDDLLLALALLILVGRSPPYETVQENQICHLYAAGALAGVVRHFVGVADEAFVAEWMGCN